MLRGGLYVRLYFQKYKMKEGESLAISDREKERLNLSMPVANDVKMGDIIQSLQEKIEDLEERLEIVEGAG